MPKFPRITIFVLIGAFILGIGTIFGFAIGRRTAFFSSRFPYEARNDVIEITKRDLKPILGTVESFKGDVLDLKTKDGKTVSTEFSRIKEILIARTRTQQEFADGLKKYREALMAGETSIQPPSNINLEAGKKGNIEAGRQVQMFCDEKECSLILMP